MKTNEEANEMVTVTIRTTVRLKDVPQILNKEGTQLIDMSLPVFGSPPRKKTGSPRNMAVRVPPKYKAKPFKAKTTSPESFTSKFLKLFTEAPTRNFDAQTLRQKLHDIGSHSSVSTAVGNVNRVYADAIQKNLDGTFCLRPLE